MNVVNIIGRASKDIELKTSANGKSYTYITVAVDNFYNGEKQTQFIPCMAWGQTAENCAKYVKKGSLIAVEGSINLRSEKKDDNSYNTIFNVSVSRVQFLTSPNSQYNKVENNNNYENKNNEQEASGNEEDAILWEY